MDLREYEYISLRPDTLRKENLQFIRAVLSKSDVYDGIALIDKVLSTGYIQPPPDYPYHGCYQVILNTDEIKLIIDYLNDAKSKLFLLAKDLSYLDHCVVWVLRCLNEKPVSYEEYKSIHPYYDLREISAEDFQKFIFDQPIAESIEDRLWYSDVHLWIDGDFEYIAALYIKIFSEADKLLCLFTRQQLEQGLSMIGSHGLREFTVLDLIFITEIDIELKKALIWSMFDVHQKLFSIEQLNLDMYDIYVYNDWWVKFAISVHSRPLLINESAMQQIQNTIFEVLTKILVDDSCGCKYAVFRGLKYLKHPDTKSFIEAYISKYQDVFSDGFIKEARWCIKEDIIS